MQLLWVGIDTENITRAFDGRGKLEIIRNAKKVFKFKNATELNKLYMAILK